LTQKRKANNKVLLEKLLQYGIKKKHNVARCQWLTPIIVATQDAEIRRITVQSQPRQIVCETLS
jgi:hypothetical protein